MEIHVIVVHLLIFLRMCHANCVVNDAKYKLTNVTNVTSGITGKSSVEVALYLTNSEIPVFASDLIDCTDNLTLLDLSNTQLEAIDEGALDFPNLMELRLDHNSIQKVNDSTFATVHRSPFSFGINAIMRELRILHLNDNPIVVIDERSFYVLPSLSKLFLMHTHLVALHLILSVMTSIYLASLRPEHRCMLTVIQIDQAEGWHKNQLMLIDANACPIELLHFDSEMTVTSNGSTQTSYTDGNFPKVFDLSYNPNGSRIFIELSTQNVTLHFAMNNLTKFDGGLINGKEHVVNLDLSSNSLKSVDLTSFTNLQTVNLSNNALSCVELPKSLKLSSLDLTGNFLDCKCAKTLKSSDYVQLDLNRCNHDSISRKRPLQTVNDTTTPSIKTPKSSSTQPVRFVTTSTVPTTVVKSASINRDMPVVSKMDTIFYTEKPAKSDQNISIGDAAKQEKIGKIIFKAVWTCILVAMAFGALLHMLLLYMRWRNTQYLVPHDPILNPSYNELQNEMY